MNSNVDMIYLDHAAATPMDERVVRAMTPYFSERFFNPASPYAPALEVRREYEAAKSTIARSIGATSDEIIITAGATESINLAFAGVSGHVITPVIEHHAVLAAAARHDHTFVEVDERGRVSPSVIKAALRPDTTLISIALANNEIGTIQPLREIAQIIKTERERRLAQGDMTPLYFHTDASQGFDVLDINVARLGVDMLTLNAGKIYGPKQVGLLYAHRSIPLVPQVVGGGQERGYRSGTENVAGTVGFAKAVELAQAHRKQKAHDMQEMRQQLETRLLDAFPEAVISGDKKHRLPGLLHISWPGVDAERLIFALETKGVFVATGSACSANKGTRSHVLTAIGLSDETADGSMRLSLGALSTVENTNRAAEEIIAAVNKELERTRV